MEHDIRWQQRFKNYQKAFGQLEKFIVKQELSDLEEQGLIKAFEYTYEACLDNFTGFFEVSWAKRHLRFERCLS